ncbi:MAG: LOG family protein [Candidatus Pacebacteria bacterium]|nr:LOG family protein [Candidatus Paceibacterota bacterium]MDD5357396.1 LOG family protein [Candidatus Paceibacterota bacterium]
MKKISVFAGNDCFKERQKHYFGLAYQTGKLLAENKFITVTGAGTGLMEEVSRGAFEAGGETMGIGLDFGGRVQSKYVKTIEIFKNLGPRQEKLITLADAYIALPGGVGTFFEIYNILGLKRLGEIPKDMPLILISDYFSMIQETLEKMMEEGFLEKSASSLYTIVNTPEEAMEILKEQI